MRKLTLEADDRRFRLLALVVVAGTALALAVVLARLGWRPLADLPAMAGSVWLSRLAIFGGTLSEFPYRPWTLGAVAWVLDLLACCLLLSGVPLLGRLPVSGQILARMRHRAFLTLVKYPGLERMALFGVALLVFIPIPGSGSVVGTFLGQLVGLTRTATLIMVALGSGLSVCTLALMADFLGQRWQMLAKSPLTAAAGFIVLLVFAWVAWLRVRRKLERA